MQGWGCKTDKHSELTGYWCMTVQTHRQTHSQVEASPIHLLYINCWRKPKFLSKPHAVMRRTCKFQTEYSELMAFWLTSYCTEIETSLFMLCKSVPNLPSSPLRFSSRPLQIMKKKRKNTLEQGLMMDSGRGVTLNQISLISFEK